MIWLDDMEAAGRAPDGDPWASPDYVPDTSQGLPPEVGNVIGEWARQQNASAGEAERTELGYQEPPPGLAAHVNHAATERWAQQQPAGRTFTLGEAYQVAEDAVGLFLEYRDMHGRSEADARIEALGEVAQGLHAWADTDQGFSSHRLVGPDWRALRDAEAQARDAGPGRASRSRTARTRRSTRQRPPSGAVAGVSGPTAPRWASDGHERRLPRLWSQRAEQQPAGSGHRVLPQVRHPNAGSHCG